MYSGGTALANNMAKSVLSTSTANDAHAHAHAHSGRLRRLAADAVTEGADGKASASTSALATATTTTTSTRRRLLLWDELPAWRRDNAYIRSGYRATSGSYGGSLRSLGYLHNESVNIWTHLAGSAMAVAVMVGVVVATAWLPVSVAVPVPGPLGRRYATAGPADVLVFGCFFGGLALCLGLSASFHALCNHSPAVAKWGNKLDYTGIVCLIVGSYVPALYYGFFCQPALMAAYLYAISLLGAACLAVCWFERFRTPGWRPWRALIFVGLGVSGVGPILHRVWKEGYTRLDRSMGLSWTILQGALYIFGAFLYAMRWPERQFPGAFDIWGSSHQIFHVLILSAAAAHMYAMTKAFDFHHGGGALGC